MTKNPLLDIDFLTQLNEYSEREIYAKIVALNLNEETLEEISGQVTTGSISLDGTSAIRRTCSLSLIAQGVDINDYYWGLNTKVKIFIGMKNFIDSSYPDIIWFPQGIYVLTSFTTSQNVNGYTISLQGKDKMCLLNGDVGGTITALSVDFGKIDIEDTDENGMGTGEYSTTDYLIKNIITEAVHVYANEPYANIIVNDLDDVGLELLEYRGTIPMYLLIDHETNEVLNTSVNGNQGGYYESTNGKMVSSIYTLGTIPLDKYDQRNNLNYGKIETHSPLILYSLVDGVYSPFTVCKITSGDVVGYRITDITYAGDLIGSVGQSITSSVLDPIVKQLGNFEYFYDNDGHFIFQKKKTYVNTSWNNLTTDSDGDSYAENAAMTSASVYSFENSNLITAFNNNPNLSNVKNDYSIWGTRKGVSGAEIPIHIRYAIDKKPFYYTAFDGTTYTSMSEEEFKVYQVTADMTLTKKGFKKEASRFGLSEDWWEVRDWVKAWEYNELDSPTSNLGTYCPIQSMVCSDSYNTALIKTSATKEITIIKQEDWNTWGVNDQILAYATDNIVFNESGQVITCHRSCAHSYTWWLNQLASGGSYANGYAYFYKPEVPKNELKGKIFSVNVNNIKYNTEWREILYHMALDYFKFNTDDDFLSNIAKNNNGFYPTGHTGYEQYYTDIQGFWRQIYDPTLTQIELFNYAKIYDKNDENDCSITGKRYCDFSEDDFSNYEQAIYYRCGKDDILYKKALDWNPYLQYYVRLQDKAMEHPYSTYYTLGYMEKAYDKYDTSCNTITSEDFKKGTYYTLSGGAYQLASSFKDSQTYYKQANYKTEYFGYIQNKEESITTLSQIYYDGDQICYKNGSQYIAYLLYDNLPRLNPTQDDSSSPDTDDSFEIGKGDIFSTWIQT